MKPGASANPGLAELMQALNFTDADLKANRDGSLSQRQRRWILLTHGTLIAVGWSFVVVLSLYYLIGEPFHWRRGDLALFGCTSIYGLVFLGFIWQTLRYQQQVRKDLKNPPAVLHEVVLKPQAMFSQRTYTLECGKHQFEVERKVHDAFKNGGKYEIYYTPHTKILLTAVPLKPDAPYAMN
jgi:hypothetical protein